MPPHDLAETLPVYVVIGSEPGVSSKALEIFMEADRAAMYVLDGLIQALAFHRSGHLKMGEQISLLLTIGTKDDEKETSGSVVVSGLDERHVWDFRVEKRWAPRR